MGEHPELMTDMEWETHLVDNGMLGVAKIPAKHKATMASLHEQMKAKSQDLASGKEMQLCGFCDSHGKLLAAGAKEQETPQLHSPIFALPGDTSRTSRDHLMQGSERRPQTDSLGLCRGVDLRSWPETEWYSRRRRSRSCRHERSFRSERCRHPRPAPANRRRPESQHIQVEPHGECLLALSTLS